MTSAKPSSTSTCCALAAVVRAIPCSSTSSAIDGNRRRGPKSPDSILIRSTSATCRWGGTPLSRTTTISLPYAFSRPLVALLSELAGVPQGTQQRDVTGVALFASWGFCDEGDAGRGGVVQKIAERAGADLAGPDGLVPAVVRAAAVE